MWRCEYCDSQFSDPTEVYSSDLDYVLGEVPKRYCPNCGSTQVEMMDVCPSCKGWKKKGDECCEKCKLVGRGALGRFTRSLPVAILRYLDEVIEGTALEEYR